MCITTSAVAWLSVQSNTYSQLASSNLKRYITLSRNVASSSAHDSVACVHTVLHSTIMWIRAASSTLTRTALQRQPTAVITTHWRCDSCASSLVKLHATDLLQESPFTAQHVVLVEESCSVDATRHCTVQLLPERMELNHHNKRGHL